MNIHRNENFIMHVRVQQQLNQSVHERRRQRLCLKGREQ